MIRLEIDPLMFGLTIAVFLLMIALLNVWLYKPMLSYMEARDQAIKNDLAEAGSNNEEIHALEVKAQAIIDNAKREAAELRHKVIEDAKLLASSKIEAKRSELAAEYTEFATDLAKERISLKDGLVAQSPAFKEALQAKFSQL